MKLQQTFSCNLELEGSLDGAIEKVRALAASPIVGKELEILVQFESQTLRSVRGPTKGSGDGKPRTRRSGKPPAVAVDTTAGK